MQLFLSIDNNTLYLKRRKVREKRRRKHFHGKAKTRKEPLETYLYAFRFLFFRNSFSTLMERKGREREEDVGLSYYTVEEIKSCEREEHLLRGNERAQGKQIQVLSSRFKMCDM